MLDQRQEIVKALRATPVVLRALADGIDEGRLRWRPAPGEWAIIEVVAHLADTEEGRWPGRGAWSLRKTQCWSRSTRRRWASSAATSTSTCRDESLRRYGLRPSGRELDAVRALLEAEAAKERRAQGDGDTELMKLCCVQLFNAAEVGDALAIWRAKTASFDAHCSIDVQLLRGAGLAETKAFLSAQRSEQARAALRWLLHCEAAGDFEDFSVAARSAWYATYCLGPEDQG